jgi:hypothetical protein
MEQELNNGSTQPGARTEQKVKRPYTKPSFQFEKVFETMALACGKIGTQGPCGLNTKNS